MTAALRKAFKFFLDNAGYVCPPGRTMCALMLARAEIWAADKGYSFDVVPDEYQDSSCMSEQELKKLNNGVIAVGVVLLDNTPECTPLTALWGVVVSADDRYLRVVKAELALEYFTTQLVTLI